MIYSECQICGLAKNSTKSANCHSCARKKQHHNGDYLNNKNDYSSGYKYCNFCKKQHDIVVGSSNEFWLLRSAIKQKYECRLHRKALYDKMRRDPSKRLRKSISNLIRDCVAKHSAFKEGSFPKYVDWTVDELKMHLESLFQPGMTWENYGRGGWHIDHRIPDSWFDYSSIKDEGFKKSWALENLQPMWEKENCSKSNRFVK